jgi:hypothetical protein
MATRWEKHGPVDGGTCAYCGAEVRAVEGMPARSAFDHTGATVEVPAWCRLRPCGHTFTAKLPLAS